MEFLDIVNAVDSLAVVLVCLYVMHLFVQGKLFSATQMSEITESIGSEIATRVIADISARLEAYEKIQEEKTAAIIETVTRFRRDDELFAMLRDLTKLQNLGHQGRIPTGDTIPQESAQNNPGAI